MLQKLGKKIPRGLLNDGGMMIRDANGLGIAIVMCQSKFKRGEGHHAICEARDEIAALICRAVNSHDALFAYAECEEARACSEDVAETVLKQHGWKPTECTSHDFMDRMRRATLAKVKE
jgi:hypothetical protein